MQPVASFSIKFSEKFFFGKPQKHLQPGFRSSQAANGIKSVQRTAGVALPFMPDCSLTAQGFRLCCDCFFTKCRRILFWNEIRLLFPFLVQYTLLFGKCKFKIEIIVIN